MLTVDTKSTLSYYLDLNFGIYLGHRRFSGAHDSGVLDTSKSTSSPPLILY